MIKECKVILHNSAVTVVEYDDVRIQFPSIATNSKTVFVDYSDGRYVIVPEDDCEKSADNGADVKTATTEESEFCFGNESVGIEDFSDDTGKFFE